ncbi:hypothetical protein [uncultured phage cr4_1]|uniref:Uncharacterized protein n=1 Tax=uncultured phage cr4_1 TaxID=2772084 RepID=A0A7M1RRL5_9CAUD|nr:hypothetical protein KNV51_gp09 [uncultured phage cr4_1]QOR57087.1 hypothetical protein [uncultured phage cr4_1]
MNGINVGTSKVSTGYKGSQNTDYIILGLTIVNTNKTYPCAKEGSLLKATLSDLEALPYTDSNLLVCNIYFSLPVNSFKYRFKFNGFDLTFDCDLHQTVNVGYGYIRNEGNYCVVAGTANPKCLSSLNDVNLNLSATYQFIFDGDIYEYIVQL